jgi:putative transposase
MKTRRSRYPHPRIFGEHPQTDDHEGEHPSRWAAIMSIAAKIGCTAQTLNEWVKKAEVDNGRPAGVPTDFAAKLKALERENRELRQANEILAQGLCLFCPGGARPPVQAIIAFIDDHREAHGVEPICKVLPIAPSTYHAHVARRAGDTRPRGEVPPWEYLPIRP